MASSYSHGVVEWVSFQHNAGLFLGILEDGFESGDVTSWPSSLAEVP